MNALAIREVRAGNPSSEAALAVRRESHMARWQVTRDLTDFGTTSEAPQVIEQRHNTHAKWRRYFVREPMETHGLLEQVVIICRKCQQQRLLDKEPQ